MIRQLLVGQVIALLLLGIGCSDSTIGPVKNTKSLFVFDLFDYSIGSPGLYTSNRDGSGRFKLVTVGDTVEFPGGPTGEKYVVGNTFPISDPQWNPQGTKIVACLEWATEASVLLLMNSDGTGKRVFSDVQSSARRPRWSPSGGEIMFERQSLGATIGIGIVDSSGRSDRSFTLAGSTPQHFETDSLYFTGDYQWGPSGLVLASASVNRSPGTIFIVGTNYSSEIFSIEPTTGSIVARLTRNTTDESGFICNALRNTIAFRRGTYGSSDNKIFFLNLTSALLDSLSVNAYCLPIMNWSTDGNALSVILDEDPDPNLNDTELHAYTITVGQPTAIRRALTFKTRSVHLFVAADAQ